MVDRAQGRKKSEFVQQSTVLANSYLDYVVNGTNYKIAYNDFVTGLGVTGTIVQEGAVTGTAILDVDGTINQIRNLESGSGIVTSVSAENGAKISHNFTANADGLPILLNTTAASPTIASIVAGSGISVAAVNAGGIQITSIADETNAQVSMHGNSTATTISTQNVPVKAAGTFVAGTFSSFTVDTTGKLTYTGSTTTTVLLTASVTLDVVGTNQNLTVHLAKNGTVISAAKISRLVSSTNTANLGVFYNVSVATSDYLEVFVSNGTGTNNITVTDCLFGVS
jgi:hypothetical protein|tara:strand:- start:1668 stop:2513 length:846 start_codon:yes stop_codon:yes gene_type:complete